MGWQKQVLGWWCAALLAPATAQQIEFPLSHYSFEEIARHMSVAGRRVSCAPEVRQRLALIYLKPRSWREARALLERALEVQFRRVSDGDWILERDPAIVGRERRLRERLARALEEQAAFQTRLLHACLDSKVPADRAATHLVRLRYAHLPPSAQQAHWARLRDEIAHAQEMPLKAALRNWRAYEWFSSEFSRFHARGRLQEFLRKYPLASFGFSEEERRWAVREAQRWRERWAPKLGHAVLKTDDPLEAQAHLLLYLGQVARAWMPVWALEVTQSQLRPPLRAREVLARGQLVRVQTLRLPPEVAAWLREDPSGLHVPLYQAEDVPLHLQIRAAWSYNGGYAYEIAVDFPRRSWIPTSPLPCADIRLQWTPADAHSHFQLLDRAWAQAYTAAYARHQQLLKAPVAHAPLPLEDLEWLGAFAAWAKAYDQEIIAEVYEGLQVRATFGDAPKENTLAELLSRFLEPCLLERHDSVWVLRHWGAFVRRASNPPLAALWRLERAQGSYGDWQAFYYATTSEQARWLLFSSIEWRPPRLGAPMPMYLSERQSLGYAWIVMAILENLPEVLRESLWDGRSTSAPLTALPLSKRRDLARILREWGIVAERLAPPPQAPEAPVDTAVVEHLWLVREQGMWELAYGKPEPSEQTIGGFRGIAGSFFVTPFPRPLVQTPTR
jgi:hypothetical protein